MLRRLILSSSDSGPLLLSLSVRLSACLPVGLSVSKYFILIPPQIEARGTKLEARAALDESDSGTFRLSKHRKHNDCRFTYSAFLVFEKGISSP